MMRAVRGAAAALVLAAASLAAQAIPTVEVTGPPGNPLTDGMATFTIRALNFIAADLPMRLQLQVSTNADFAPPLFADTTVDGPVATVIIPRLLPGSGNLFWRAVALTARAGAVPSPITGPRVAPTHLRLISPNRPGGQSLTTRRPTFVWSASRIPPSAGEWEFELRVEQTATGQPVLIVNTTDTAHVVSDDGVLETNTSYRWRVLARIRATGDSVQQPSAASFVILSENAPLATLLYQNFPNPFPNPSSSRTCIWFDLQRPATVSLAIVDLRSGLVARRLIPGVGGSGVLPAGRYGRPDVTVSGGCDERFTWDGTAPDGRVVPPGIYLIVLHADGKRFTKSIVFNGR